MSCTGYHNAWLHFCSCIQVSRLAKYLSDCGFKVCKTDEHVNQDAPSTGRLNGMQGVAMLDSHAIKISWN